MVFVSASYLILKGLGFGKEFSCLLWFKLWRKCSMNWRKAAVLEFWITLKREKYSENVPRKFVCNSSPEVMPPIFFSREPEWEIQHFCPPLRLPCSLILFLALTVPPLASPPKTYAIIAERVPAGLMEVQGTWLRDNVIMSMFEWSATYSYIIHQQFLHGPKMKCIMC